MDYHLLDLIMYIILTSLIWIITEDEFKSGLGTFVGITIVFLFTVIYTVLFSLWPDWNWVNIFDSLFSFVEGIDLVL